MDVANQDRPIPALNDVLRHHLGQTMQALYAPIVDAQLPPDLAALLARFESALERAGEARDEGFRNELMRALQPMRGFALSLVLNHSRADDLVQETLLKAWANRKGFQPGTNFQAWVFTILRNQFYSEQRKRKREVEDVDGIAAGQLEALPDQDDHLTLKAVWVTMGKLPVTQREALMLIGFNGLTYEAAADVLGCQVGTVKSRVSRARSYLSNLLGINAESFGNAVS